MVALAFAFPWFALEMSEDISDQVSAPAATDHPDSRREAIGDLALTAWPWVSVVLMLGGSAAVAYGFIQWKERQEVLDDLRTKERDLLKKQIETMTPAEIADKATAEAELEDVTESASRGASPASQDPVGKEAWRARILAIETRVLTLIQAGFKLTHAARPHVRGPRGAATIRDAKQRRRNGWPRRNQSWKRR